MGSAIGKHFGLVRRREIAVLAGMQCVTCKNNEATYFVNGLKGPDERPLLTTCDSEENTLESFLRLNYQVKCSSALKSTSKGDSQARYLHG